jgi:hypothetical protein
MDKDKIRLLIEQARLDWLESYSKDDVEPVWRGIGPMIEAEMANEELARLVDDVQKNRNRGD